MNNINLELIKEKLSDKAGKDCDVLLMTATPIPRTLTMTIYGDMDLSIIKKNQIFVNLSKPIVNLKIR